MDLDPERFARSPLVPAIVGAFIGLRWAPGDSIAAKAGNMAAATGFAYYVAPLVSELGHLTSPGAMAAVSVLVGMLGLSAAAALVAGIKSTPIGQILTGWLSRKG